MKTFLTGSTGFLGRSVRRLLEARGFECLCLQRRARLGEAGVFLHDLQSLARDPGELREALLRFEPDAVIHLAWDRASGRFRDDPCHYLQNLRASQNLVDLLADALPRACFVGVGSQAEYGVRNELLTPQTPCQPSVAYGKAKRLAGEYALARLPGRAAWLRLLTAYGPGDDPNKFIPYVVRCLQSGEVPVLSPGEQRWDFLHVEDAAEAIVRSALQRVSGVHVLASGEVASLKHVATSLHSIARALGLPAPEPHFGGRPYNPNELCFLAGDPASLQQASGWTPKIRLEQGLRSLFSASGTAKVAPS